MLPLLGVEIKFILGPYLNFGGGGGVIKKMAK